MQATSHSSTFPKVLVCRHHVPNSQSVSEQTGGSENGKIARVLLGLFSHCSLFWTHLHANIRTSSLICTPAGGPRAHHHLQGLACAHVNCHRHARPQCQLPSQACGQVPLPAAHPEGHVQHLSWGPGPGGLQYLLPHQQQADRHCSAGA